MRQAGDTWDKVVVDYVHEDGSWSFEVGLDRAEAVTRRHAAASQLANAGKPWWKFWQ